MNGNVEIGSGSSSVSINKDISAGYALDVSGITNLRNNLFVLSDVSFGTKLFVSGDSSFNSNLSVGNDLSLNGNLYVVKRALFLGDVSMNGNLKIGSGSLSFVVNKDISAGFALDVSGRSQIRGNLDVAGVFTVNGAPVSGGGTLTGNVQVGSNSGFVTIDKPQFYADPSLMIFYNFDTSYNTTRIQNMTNINGLYDGSMNGITTGLTIIDENNPKFGTASFRNTPGSGGKGISIGPINTSIPVSSTMTFSVWVRKPNNPVSPDWDRIFEFSNYTTVGSVPGQQNNTIALDISADGFVYPKLTYNGPGNNSCFTTLSSPIVSYNLCNGIWNHILWVINANKSFIYINGALTQNDNITNFPATTTRASGFIAYSYVLSDVTYGNDFSGNIDNFRYYKDKALNYPEIYQLYNNSFYTLDICGGFLANGSSVIYEPSGTPATLNSGSLTLLHGDAGGSSSIVFKSAGGQGDYAYIEYDENVNGIVQSVYKWDLSTNVPTTWSNTATFASTGLVTTALTIAPTDSSLSWVATSLLPTNRPTNFATYCISFNQTNIYDASTTRINYLETTVTYSNNFSISLWVYPTFNSITNMLITIASLSDGVTGYCAEIAIDGNGQNFVVYFNDGSADNGNAFVSGINATLNQWHHFVLTYNDSTNTAKTYVNGSNTASYTLASVNTFSKLLLGMRWGSNTGTPAKGFRGGMCFVNMFNEELSNSDVLYLYNNPSYTGTTTERGLMTIGIESETGYITGDRISLFPSNGTGFVGVNTKNPITTLDISGQVRIYEGNNGTIASGSSGSLTLEHANTGGTSSLVFKASNSSTTSDYAYVQYQDSTGLGRPFLKYDLSFNIPTLLTNATNVVTVPSTGTGGNTLGFYPTIDNSFVWLNTTTYTVGSINGVTPAYCLSFNQTNLLLTQGTYNVPRINYFTHYGIPINTSFTISAWIRPTGLTYTQGASGSYGRYCVFHTVYDGTSGTVVVQMYIEYGNANNPGKLFVLINNDGSNFEYTSVPLTIDTWWHVAFVYNSNTLNGQLYLNGKRTNIYKSGIGYTGKLVNHNFVIWGHMYNASTNYTDKGFRGQLAFINLFNLPLAESDVKYLYDNPYNTSSSSNDRGLLTIGIENDATGYINSNDSIVLWPGAGNGFVGINNKTPQSALDVSGQIQASSYNATSDYRTKDNVMKLDTTFTVDGLNPVTYQFKPTGKQDVGFLAHEVQELYPFLVNGMKDGPNNQSLNYNGFIGILTKEIKDLKKKVSEQEAKALEQDARIQTLEQSAKALEKLVSDLINK